MSAAFVARKGMTLYGRRYARGQSVDLEQVSPELRRRLVEQKRVVPRAAGATAGPATTPSVQLEEVSHEEVVVVSEAAPKKLRGWSATAAKAGSRCGDHGGRMRNGQPCGRVSFGLCQHHKGN